MPALSLPNEPNLEQLRHQARDLQRMVRAGDPEALAEVAEHHPRLSPADRASFRLSAAQFVLARRYGFASWARLKQQVDVLRQYSRFPARMSAEDSADLADQFLRLACLNYDGVGLPEWAQARTLLLDHPEIVEGNVHAAAAAADAAALARILDADRSAARREGGPYRWEPLLYLAYSRYDPAVSQDAALSAAKALLGAGADPNSGFLWHGLPTPFTVLTGVFGEGEQGPVRQPRHPHSLPLARLLLEAGADPNDGQALYNRMFEKDNDHLELLFEFGLGTGDGGPWRRRMGESAETPAAMLRGQLSWAITHGMTERVRLLADHGVDLQAPSEEALSSLVSGWSEIEQDVATPAALAATTGHPELVDVLVARGAGRPTLSAGGSFVAAVLAADREAVQMLIAANPSVLEQARATRPGLMAWAAVTGGVGAVELLVELGFDINARGRTDVPSNQAWHTALHGATEHNNVELAQALLRLGADPNIKDMRFNGTPLDWAHHLGQQQLIDLLEPITDLSGTV